MRSGVPRRAREVAKVGVGVEWSGCAGGRGGREEVVGEKGEEEKGDRRYKENTPGMSHR